ncbi:MAG: DUF3788 domain-containing protein [Acidobacteriaceae bacterium]
MENANAFIGKLNQPSPEEISTALGKSEAAWSQFLAWMVDEHGITAQEWKSVSAKYGWSLRLKIKERTIVYLAPCDGCFTVSFVLGPKAVEAAHQSGLPNAVVEAIDNAPRYAEGTGVRFTMKQIADLAPARKLATIKLEH